MRQSNTGVSRTSDAQQVTRAYRTLCLSVHPDKNKEDGASKKVIDFILKSFLSFEPINEEV